MKTTYLALSIVTAGLLLAAQLCSAEEKERKIGMRTESNQFVTAETGNSLTLGATKIGSKQTFTLIDLNGGDLADKDEVKILYTPNTQGKPDPAKSSYWKEVSEGVKRNREGDVFKIKTIDSKYGFVAPSGKFVGQPIDGGVLGVTTNASEALVVEFVDIVPKAADKKPAAKQ